MKALKFIISLILAIILIGSAGVALGSFAMTEAVSEEAMEKAIVESNAIDEITSKILSEYTVNMGGEYGETLKVILKSDAMTEFFSAYTAGCLQNELRGEEGTAGSGYYNEIGSDDLYQAFSAGVDECMSDGSISMSQGERKIFDAAIATVMPTLTKGINYVIQEMDLVSFVNDETAEKVRQAQIITSPPIRYGSIIAGLLACLGLIILRHEKRTGFLWCGICILLVAGLFFVYSIMLSGTQESSENFMSLSGRMMYIMLAYGVKRIAIVGGIIGAACLPAFGVVKAIFK